MVIAGEIILVNVKGADGGMVLGKGFPPLDADGGLYSGRGFGVGTSIMTERLDRALGMTSVTRDANDVLA